MQAKNIGKSFKDKQILKNINLEFEIGKFYLIKGNSGSGKTTLLNIVGALESPNEGQILIKNRDMYLMNEDDLARLRRDEIGFVFQSYLLNPKLSAVENVMLPMLAKRSNYKDAKQKAITLMDLVGLEDKLDSFPYDLSGGEQQRVAIARFFANNPNLILADEPAGNLDSENEEHIIRLLVDLAKMKDCCIVMVSHDDTADKYADCIIQIRKGEILSVKKGEHNG